MVCCKSILENLTCSNSRRAFCVIIGIVSLGLGLRVLGLNKGIWLDEFSSIAKISQGDLIANLRGYDHPPLYFVFLKLWSFINSSEPFLRLFSVIWGVGTIIVVIKWIEGYSPLAGIISGICCAVMPALLRFSQEIRGYSLLLFATALSFYFASQIAKNPNKRSYYIGLTAGLTAAVATHLVGVMLLPTIFLFLLLSMPSRQKHHVLSIILWLVIPGVVFVLEYYFFMSAEVRARTAETWWMPQVTIDLIGCVAAYLLGASSLSWTLTLVQKYGPMIAVPLMAVLFSSFVVFFGSLWTGNWRRSFPLLAAAATYCLLLIGFSFLKTPIFGKRTALPAMIPLIGFIGVQAATIKLPKIHMISRAALLIISMNTIVAWTAHNAWTPYEYTRDIAQTLQQRRQAHDVVIFYPSYFSGPIRYYYHDLPKEDQICIKPEASFEEIEGIKKTIQKAAPSAVFLVVRNDSSVKKAFTTHQHLQEVLASEIGSPEVVKVFDTLSLTHYRRAKNEKTS
jgi:4-amino-4-deoxy-L-arabinose transferase-like glycosyltransferase